ncbi:MAG: hypothetical protein GY865_07085 [candidate division Zixibacteria bacterium]|nr:hypothetical protein [candidate division Zixibacteria bacterium]
MIKFTIFAIVLITLVSSAIAQDKSTLQAIKVSETFLDNMPLKTRIGGLDMANGFIAMFTDSFVNRRNEFMLFDSNGNEIISKRSTENMSFWHLDLKSCDGAVIVGEGVPEGRNYFSAYDYSGKMLISPFSTGKSTNPVMSSPSMKYLYSRNEDILSGSGEPMVWDATGNLLAEFDVENSMWQMAAINDSLLLFQDWNHLKIISIPSMAVKKEYVVNGIIPPPIESFCSMDPSGDYYAFEGEYKLAICNLTNGDIQFIDKGNVGYRRGRIGLSESGEYLFCFHSRRNITVTIFQRFKEGYRAIGVNQKVPFDGEVDLIYMGPYFWNNKCIINAENVTQSPRVLEYKSYIIDISNQSGREVNGVALQGFATPAMVGNKAKMHVFKIRSSQNDIGLLRKYHLEEASNE